MRSALHINGEVAGIRSLFGPLLDEPGWHRQPVRIQLERQAAVLLDAHSAGDRRVGSIFSCWHPELIGAAAAKILAHPVTLDDCLLALAREHGFADTEAIAGEHRESFERAVDAVVHGELDDLRALLDAEADLVTARSAFGHRATLLHYVGSNGVETWRQVVPGTIEAITALVLDRGADVHAEAAIYGGSTTIHLAATSCHPRDAGLMGPLLRCLVAAGADGTAPAMDSDKVVPILSVADFTAAVRCFTEELGWHLLWDWGEPPDFGGVVMGQAEVFLCQGGQGQSGTWIMCFVDDVDAYAASLRLTDATIIEGPIDRPWGVRELLIELPDQHVIRFGGPTTG